MPLTPCPSILPELSDLAAAFGRAWVASPHRPTPKAEIIAEWRQLLRQWSTCSSLPLFVRKHKDNRGFSITHQDGRELVPTDNSPAHWVFTEACAGRCPSLVEVEQLLATKSIPVAMIRKTVERDGSKYMSTFGNQFDVNRQGWKLAHIVGIGMRQRKRLQELPLDTLTSHFLRFMDPGNMFVVPLSMAGIAEVSHVSELFAHRSDA